MKRSGFVTAMLALGASSGALAKAWPTPAAGDSASGGPEVLFTFDDGPNPRTTPLVLDTLAAHHIHAVFFLVGDMAGSRSPKVAAIVRRILRDGHVIATHTMKHGSTTLPRGPARSPPRSPAPCPELALSYNARPTLAE